jgi:polyphosphate kinase
MGRNLFRRIEIAFPVLDRELKGRVIEEGLKPYLADESDAWELGSDGSYRRLKPKPRGQVQAAQQQLLNRLAQAAKPSS